MFILFSKQSQHKKGGERQREGGERERERERERHGALRRKPSFMRCFGGGRAQQQRDGEEDRERVASTTNSCA